MTEKTGEAPARPVAPRPPIQDLFASAVHRFGAVWADLVVASAAALGLATVPVVAVRQGGGTTGEASLVGLFAYGIAYFCIVGFVLLRGLPEPAPRRRVVWTYATAVMIAVITGLLILVLNRLGAAPYVVAFIPLLLFAVPAIAAGDVLPGMAVSYSARLAIRNFSRVWLVWLITILFSAPVAVAMFLAVDAFASDSTSFLAGLALAAPVVWPFSALFTRALYGDLTGRNVVAPEDRS